MLADSVDREVVKIWKRDGDRSHTADYAASVRKNLEREQKFVPNDEFRLAELGERAASRVFVSTYHDTPDLRLARHGITLRNRVEDGTRLWQLKIPSGASRIELESSGPPARPPAEMTDLLAVHLRDQELVKVARLRTRRQTVLKDGAEIVEDAVAVMEAQRVVRRFREIEVELLDGDERSLQTLESMLRRAGATPAPFIPKLYQALDLSFDREPGGDRADGDPAAALGSALAEQHGRLLDHDPGTRLGADPEDLHQMRVATRRARAFLRAARGVVEPAWAEELRTELGWLGSVLGPARDADVLLVHLAEAVDAVRLPASVARGLLAALEGNREDVRAAAVAALSEQRYFDLLDRLESAEHPPPAVEPVPSLADLWWAEFKKTRSAMRKLDRKSADEDLHAGRIRVKRARYAAELAAAELGEAGERFVDAAKVLQDVLGEYQDSAVAERWIREWGSSSKAAAGSVELLVERERKVRKKARRAWPEAWKRLESRGRDARK